MKKLLIGVWHPSVILTYLGICFSVCGLLMLTNNPKIAVICLICAALCDMFDGTVAKCFKRTDMEKKFGIQIDSLADIGSFVIFPACLLVKLCGHNVASYIVACLFVVAGVARLAWFNITTEDDPDSFRGLPVTCSALIIPTVYIVLSLLSVSVLCTQITWCSTFALTALMFIANFRLAKPNMLLKILMLLAGVGAVAIMLVIL